MRIGCSCAPHDEDILEYIEISEAECGVRLTMDEARIEAANFLELCFLIVQPLPGEPDYPGPPLITL